MSLWCIEYYDIPCSFTSEGRKKSQDNCENNFKMFEISLMIHILNISGMKEAFNALLCKENLMGNLLEYPL